LLCLSISSWISLIVFGTACIVANSMNIIDL
jgi:hypothetical protein